MLLVVVESPTKAKKIQQFLGDGYQVLPSGGHVRDLPPKELGVDLSTFRADYEVLEQKASFLARIRAAAKGAEHVFLASDPDREGEAIAWHLAQELRLKSYSRARFDQITAKAVEAALKAAGPLDTALVDAQQARRILDRIVGWKVSPLLQPLGKNHSAGRVQSAALHLVVEREKARTAFKPRDYWTLSVRYGNGLVGRYATLNDKGEVEDTQHSSQAEADAVVARAQGPHLVKQVERKPSERKAPAPFTTMELQQAAGRRLKLSIDATMQLAQELFEGGHITYHRTDSPALSEEALAMARAFIAQDFPAGLPDKPNVSKAKGNAQEAHEAIRPTSLEEDLPEGLAGDAAALYRLIRARFLASQCKPAVYDTTTVVMESGDTAWRARGSVRAFEGWQRYADDVGADDDKQHELPSVEVGQILELVAIDSAKKQTQPPPRFTLLSLAKEMERTGIGRPSTYAQIAGKEGVLLRRQYIEEDSKGFVAPTARGHAVDEVLSEAFASLVAVDYTAQLEETLDAIAEGKASHVEHLRTWWTDFERRLGAAPSAVEQLLRERPELAAAAPDAPKPTGKQCPRCGEGELLLCPGKRGEFLACSRWRATPKCDYTAPPDVKAAARPCPRCSKAMEEVQGKSGPYVRCLDKDGCGYMGDVDAQPHPEPCPKCQGSMERARGKHGPYARCLKKDCEGTRDLADTVDEKCPQCLTAPMRDKGDFLACSTYPACKGTWDKKGLAQARKLNRTCPKCTVRRLRPGKNARGPFVGCSGYPNCKHLEEKPR